MLTGSGKGILEMYTLGWAPMRRPLLRISATRERLDELATGEISFDAPSQADMLDH